MSTILLKYLGLLWIVGFDMKHIVCSNLDAGRRFGIPVRGTHSHAFVSSYMVHSLVCPCNAM